MSSLPIDSRRERLEAAQAPRRALTSIRQVRDGLSEVRVGTEVVGYVETAGPVFVSLAGPRYDAAVEVAQSLSILTAVTALIA